MLRRRLIRSNDPAGRSARFAPSAAGQHQHQSRPAYLVQRPGGAASSCSGCGESSSSRDRSCSTSACSSATWAASSATGPPGEVRRRRAGPARRRSAPCPRCPPATAAPPPAGAGCSARTGSAARVRCASGSSSTGRRPATRCSATGAVRPAGPRLAGPGGPSPPPTPPRQCPRQQGGAASRRRCNRRLPCGLAPIGAGEGRRAGQTLVAPMEEQ